MKKKNCIGILAHVDAGKTTLSEGLMYLSGSIKNFGRVDHGTAFLDTFEMERKRGITIFSKQAVLTYGDFSTTLLDTPGHADFSAEMERTLDVLDAAVLVVSGPEGVQSHTVTVWRLLRQRKIPTIVFVNKMDMCTASPEAVLKNLRHNLGEGFYNISERDCEAMALGDESLLELFLERGDIPEDVEITAFREGLIFPCRFGSALKLEGVEDFLGDLAKYTPPTEVLDSFGAKVFKVSRDEKNVRLTHMKVTGGKLRVRDLIKGRDWEAKAAQLRVYSGPRFKAVEEASAGDVIVVPGLDLTAPGMGLGAESGGKVPELLPVMTYSLILPEGADIPLVMKQIKEIEEEEPTLSVSWNERVGDLTISLMGPIQKEIVRHILDERFGLEVDFGPGAILYKETIRDTVEGVGHYEPLRHYAEVHLLLEPAERGSGVTIRTEVSEDRLDKNWQRLILTHLYEKDHLGVLTGSPITDINISLVAGRAHKKHTEGGDFRQATYRAVRQGLMQAESVLLEPYYSFTLEVPVENTGRALTDLKTGGCRTDLPLTLDETTLIEGKGPARFLQDYPEHLAAYSHGLGRISLGFGGYYPCEDQDEVVEASGYNPDSDVENSADSIFCSHGAGVVVKWDRVFENMHLPPALEEEKEETREEKAVRYAKTLATDAELMRIFEKTYGPVKRDRLMALRRSGGPSKSSEPGFSGSAKSSGSGKASGSGNSGGRGAGDEGFTALPMSRVKTPKRRPGPEYLLVDGYNIIFAWDELKSLADDSLDLARLRLTDILRNFQGFIGTPVIVVFDAYKVKGGQGSVERYGDFSVVYTKEGETADNYIERVTNEIGKRHPVRVATSDGLEQLIVLGHGALRISAREFREEVEEVNRQIRDFLG